MHMLEGDMARYGNRELQLDLCGRCLPDYILRASLASAPNSLPSLTKLSLKGAYSLSDDGLAAIISSAPLLSSLNLCQCSLLTSEGITYLADNLGPALRELYIDNCQNVCAMSILPSLKKANCLEVLSMAGISSVSNKFVRELIPVCGSTIKELNFAGCSKLTASAIKIIGENCPQLLVLDIRNLTRLKDVALGHLANGCRAINRLLLRRSSFSDEAIAAFVETSGTNLIELSLNNIDKVGHQTATAISRRCCMCLQKLDLSFCRRMSDQALGLVVTDLFLKGHSNSSVEIVGLGGNILGDIHN
ncbi:F-box/LRR-repeat protein 4 [Carex littledalei]|uniref:F-box/LRR-repeat protein 4 n=1 Tax=Carex littledalei TaxID=544730 RepID=A0A833RHD9_9POAL|nr:F-box/LRR-repeat protein 4 [Carex littledalei]